jgi:1,4-dihydroxy-6-naphthoate synthase
MMCHAQELAEDVARAHIQLYVNEYSLDIGNKGRLAIEHLYECAIAHQLIPSFDFSLLR